MKNLQGELTEMRFALGLTKKVYCDDEEQERLRVMDEEGLQLPGDIEIEVEGPYFRYMNTEISDLELIQLLLYRQADHLCSIKNSMVFFVVLVVISLIASLIIALS